MLLIVIITGMIITFNAHSTMGCIGTRAASMGYAGVASVNDSTVIYWNPALLSEAPNGFQFQHDVSPQVDNFNGEYVIPRLAMSFSLKQDNIGFCYVENLGREYYILGVGFKLTDKLSIGACLDLDSKYGRDFVLSADCSINYRLNDNWNFAILCQSFQNYRPSMAYVTGKTTICFELYDITDEVKSQHTRIGIEQKFGNLFLRIGANNFKPYLKNTNNYATFYYGISYEFKNIEISISAIQGNSYSMGTSYSF